MATQYKVDIGTNPEQVPTNGMLGTAAFVNAEQLQVYSATTATSADTATKLTTGRTISTTGDVAYTSGSFDGTASVTGTATLATTGVAAGTYKSVTVDTKGRVTAGTNPTTLGGYGITDAQPLDATLTALAGVTTSTDKVIYATAADTFTTMTVTSAARTVLDDTTVGAMLTTMGGAPLASPALTGTPTAPTPTVGDSSTKVATTAFANPASSLASSGYQKLPSGLIIQWGSYTAKSSDNRTVTLPLAFSAAVVTCYHSFGQGGAAYAPRAIPVGLTQLQLVADTWGAGDPTVPHYWCAMGY